MAGALILGPDYRILLWDRNIQVYRFVGLFGYNVEHPGISIMVLHLAYWYGDLHKDMHTLGGCMAEKKVVQGEPGAMGIHRGPGQ